jgi:SAM-dependent methyltransferase
VIGGDHSEAMLAAARAALGESAAVDWRAGELEALPIADGEVDAVFSNLALGHIADLGAVARECARVLRPGGVAVVTDLSPHGEEWMRDELAVERLGIPPAEVAGALGDAGFVAVEELAVEDRYRMRSASGRVARLGLFLVRGFRGARS